MDNFACIIFPLFIAIAAASIIYSVIAARKRRDAMAELARELGMTWRPEDPYDMPSRYSRFDLFNRGSSRHAENLLCGTLDGRQTVAFDYRYTTGSGKNRTTHHYQGCLIELPVSAPELKMRGEGLFDRMASWIGYDDIDFESDEFSRRYHVKCTDRRFAYDVFHTRLIEYFLGLGRAPELEMDGPLLLVSARRGGIDDTRRLVEIARHVAGSIPDYVIKQRGAWTPPEEG